MVTDRDGRGSVIKAIIVLGYLLTDRNLARSLLVATVRDDERNHDEDQVSKDAVKYDGTCGLYPWFWLGRSLCSEETLLLLLFRELNLLFVLQLSHCNVLAKAKKTFGHGSEQVSYRRKFCAQLIPS